MIKNSAWHILFASLVGTTIEFFDFYIYANAAVLVFPSLFFPISNPTTVMLQSLATFAVAFFARPIGSAFFGHFGDRIGRKTTLVAALLTMGISTVIIGFLPTYEKIGLLAPLLLILCRFGQGFGLGGEWGGAILLAVENAPCTFANCPAPTGTLELELYNVKTSKFTGKGYRCVSVSVSFCLFAGVVKDLLSKYVYIMHT